MTEDNRISEIRDLLNGRERSINRGVIYANELWLIERLREILYRPSPPNVKCVWFPGDTVPSGVCVVSKHGLKSGAHFTTDGEWTIPAGLEPYVEVPMPSPEQWQATVDRAHQARLAEATAQPLLSDPGTGEA